MINYANRDMRRYFRDTVLQKQHDYFKFVMPILIRSGFKENEMIGIFNNNQVRIRWGKDWNNFTIHFNNPINDPTWKLDNAVHSLVNGKWIPNCRILTCFIHEKGNGPLLSLAMTDLHTLTNSMKVYGIINKTKNRFNSQQFMTLPFSHRSLNGNIWGIGIK